MTVIVRRAKTEDAPAIADFALRLSRQHQDYDALRFTALSNYEGAVRFYDSQTTEKNSRVFVAELNGKVVGFAFLEFEKLNYADLLKSAIRLHDLYVNEDVRGSQAGILLTNAVKKAAQEFGATKVILSVAVQNDHARNFFERAGFKPSMIEMKLDLTQD